MVAEAAPGPPGPDGGAATDGPGAPRIPPPSALARIVFDPETGVTASRKEFTRVALMAAIVNALPYGLGSADLTELQLPRRARSRPDAEGGPRPGEAPRR